MILIELTAAIDAAGTLKTFYVGDEGFTTKPTDTPANTHFESRLLDPGAIGLHAFSDGKTGGNSKLEVGEIKLVNVDGELDDWVNYSFDGRPIVIRMGDGGAYPASFTTVLTGTLDGVTADWTTVILRLRDKMRVLDKPLLTATYKGDNVAPDGVEGTPDDIKGNVKPRFWGKVFNATPVQVNASKLIYEVGVCQSIDKVYDKAAELTKGADYASLNDMMTNAPAVSTFRAWPAGGYFRLGTSPQGTVTFDGTEGATAADRTTAQVIKRIALLAGLAVGEISAADITAVDALNAAQVGVWVDGEDTAKSLISKVGDSIGLWCGFDNTGLLRVKQLTTPSGAPVAMIFEEDIQDKVVRKAPKEGEIPAYRVTILHTRNNTVQTTDLAGTVTTSLPARVAFLAEEFRKAEAEDVTLKTQWLLSEPLEFETLLTSAADAAAEATRRLQIYKVRRDFYEVKVSLPFLYELNLKFMDVIGLQLPRFNLVAGRNFRLLGLTLNMKMKQVTLTLWG